MIFTIRYFDYCTSYFFLLSVFYIINYINNINKVLIDRSIYVTNKLNANVKCYTRLLHEEITMSMSFNELSLLVLIFKILDLAISSSNILLV